jgi:hypothetical protein
MNYPCPLGCQSCGASAASTYLLPSGVVVVLCHRCATRERGVPVIVRCRPRAGVLHVAGVTT